jgi:hypothetical protein
MYPEPTDDADAFVAGMEAADKGYCSERGALARHAR